MKNNKIKTIRINSNIVPQYDSYWRGILKIGFSSIAAITLTMLILMPGIILGQTPSPEPLKNIIAPSPNAATFMRYGDYPVNYSTGLADINIPLFEVNEEDVKMPVSISYHASGRKSSISFSPLGGYWALNAGGMISRVIKGRPDILPFQAGATSISQLGGTLTLDNYTKVADLAFDNDKATTTTPESQYDIFTYSFAGKNGKFIIKEGAAILLSGDPIKVDAISEQSFLLTDENGTKYLFGEGNNLGGVESTLGVLGNTSWLLNSIILLNGQQINFKYKSTVSSINSAVNIKGNINYFKKYTYSTVVYSGVTTNVNWDIPFATFRDYSMCFIKEIDFPQGKIVFNYDETNFNLLNTSLYNALGEAIKKIEFTYQNLPGVKADNNNALLLDKLSLQSGTGETIEKYSFGYNVIPNMQMGTSCDWWGYVNAAGAGTVPATQFMSGLQATPISIGSSSAKTPDYSYKSYGLLNQINFPTGGSTQFIYEPNRYLTKSGVLMEGPGVRLQQVLTDDGFGKKIKKNYKYGVAESGAGQLLYEPNIEDYKREWIDLAGFGSGTQNDFKMTEFSSEPNMEIAEAYNLPVYYAQVTEYNVDFSTDIPNGKTVYKYSIPDLNITKIGLVNNAYKPVFPIPCYAAKLLNRSIFKYNAQGYVIQKEEDFEYAVYNERTIPELFITRYIKTNVDPYEELEVMKQPEVGIYQMYIYGEIYNTLAGATRIVSETAKEYVDGNAMTTSASYNYNSLSHLFPTSITMIKSNGQIVKTMMKYPGDYSNVTSQDPVSAGINNLNAIHKVSPVIEKSVSIIGSVSNEPKLLSSVFNVYMATKPFVSDIYTTEAKGLINDFNISSVLAGKIIFDNRYVKKASFSYDLFGHLIEQQKVDDIPESYIWGYGGKYPVARIRGKHYNEALNQSAIDLNVLNSLSSSTEEKQVELKKLYGLSNSLVENYTYIPLVGTKTQTDTKGYTMSYEYDNFSRLSFVRNADGNILKKMQYDLSNSSYGTSISVYASSYTSSFTKNDCAAGQFGSSSNYSAGSFVSTQSVNDAYQQAIDKTNSYGQLYANQVGVCTEPNIILYGNVDYNVATYTRISFLQNGVVKYTKDFPGLNEPPNLMVVAPGTYQVRFSFLPVDRNIYTPDFWMGTNANPHQQQWAGYSSSNPNSNFITTVDIVVGNSPIRFESNNANP